MSGSPPRSLKIILATLAATLAALPATAGARAVDDASPPIPGGLYEGQTERGAQVKIRVGTDGGDGTIGGRLAVRCGPGSAAFTTGDGTFDARRRNPRGKLLFAAAGRFAAVDRVVGEITRGAGRGRCAPAEFEAELTEPAGVRSKTVTYGPFHVHASAGGHGHGMNFFLANAERPCSNCYIVGMAPDLVYGDDSTANYDTGAMLHHAVLFNAAEPDATCLGTPLGNIGERFFAAGNERTTFTLPSGYGYRVSPGDTWRFLADLMNMSDQMQALHVRVTYFYVPAPAALEPVIPVWLDINNCGNSQYSIPAGHSDTHWDYEVPPALEGSFVAMGGHLHDDGVEINVTNDGEMLCNSRAGYGQNPAYMGHLESMSGCAGDPLARVEAGDTLRLHSIYDSAHAQHDVMGIVLGYLDPEP